MAFLYFKALHLIFMVTWFAGLFYIVRLFVYQTEALQKSEEERRVLVPQFKLMARRLWYGITWPSAVILLGMGVAMLVIQPFWLQAGFMHVKLGLVLLLYVYHFYCHYIFVKLQRDEAVMSALGLRIWNEVATLFLVSIVFLIVLKNSLDMMWGVIGLVAFTVVQLMAIRIYKKVREGK